MHIGNILYNTHLVKTLSILTSNFVFVFLRPFFKDYDNMFFNENAVAIKITFFLPHNAFFYHILKM